MPAMHLIAAPFAPFDAAGAVAPAVVAPYAAWLHARGVAGAFVNGTTGEGCSLSLDERRLLAEAWVAAAPAGFRVIVHVGALALPDARALAAHAQRIGAAAVAAVAPSFFKPDAAALAQWCAAVAAAAPALPFYYYHIPAMTGVQLRVRELLPLLLAGIPNLGGIKFTHEDLLDYGRCLSLHGQRLECAYGRDEALLAALALGAPSAVGSTYNLWPGLYRALIAAFARGDQAEARRLQEEARARIDVLIAHGGLPAMKAAMVAISGIDCGPCRLPLIDPDAARRASLLRSL